MAAVCSSWTFQVCLAVLAVVVVGGVVGVAIALAGESPPIPTTQPSHTPTMIPTTIPPSSAPTQLQWVVTAEILPPTIDDITTPTNDPTSPTEIVGFGQTMKFSTDGKRLAVASPLGHNERGRVDVYEPNSTTATTESSFLRGGGRGGGEQWVLVANTVYGEFGGDLAGWGMDLSEDGSTLVVGSPGGGGGGGGSGGEGLVRVYRVVHQEWTQIGQTLVGPMRGSQFGYSVDLNQDGTSLVVGAPGYSKTTLNNNNDSTTTMTSREGMVRVYALIEDTQMWIEEFERVGNMAGDEFGYSVDMDLTGRIIIVSSPGDDTKWRDGGRLFWFQQKPTQEEENGGGGGGVGGLWEDFLVGEDIVGDEPDQRYGSSMEMSSTGTTVVVGVPRTVRNSDYSGFVDTWSYSPQGGGASQTGFPVTGVHPLEEFGTDVSMDWSGTSFVAAGRNSYNNNDNNNNYDENTNITGSARVYVISLGVWRMLGDEIAGLPLGGQQQQAPRATRSGPSVAFQTNMLRFAIAYESVLVPVNGGGQQQQQQQQSRPLIRIFDYLGVASGDVATGGPAATITTSSSFSSSSSSSSSSNLKDNVFNRSAGNRL